MRNIDSFEPLVEMWQWIKSLVPDSLKPGKPHFNFITVHYLYMIGLTIIGSIMIYPAGVTRYIDALFFAAGAATQSGLNSVDVNKLHTYQQIVLYFLACVANPIFINTAVVFIRLYWFEQRFDHIVKESQRARRTRTRSRTVSEAIADSDPARVERGVGGRPITVLHHTTKPNGMSGHSATTADDRMNEKDRYDHLVGSVSAQLSALPHASSASSRAIDSSTEDESNHTQSRDSSETPPDHHPHSQTWLGAHPALKRDITFADEVEGDGGDLAIKRQPTYLERIPERRNSDYHIAFLQRQRDARNDKDKGALRIPGPKDFDKGDVPHEVGNHDEHHLHRSTTKSTLPASPNPTPRSGSDASEIGELNGDDHPVKRGITINEPDRPRREQREEPESNEKSHRINLVAPLRKLRHSKTDGTIIGRTASAFSRNRTFSFTKSQDRDMVDPTPYLSWQPTIGRNSVFINLTEEQREELGGIEYRALKTLALILVTYFFGFHILGVVVFVPWIVRSGTFGGVVDMDGQNRAWWGIFTPASMFNDLGFTLTPDSMVSFQTAVMPLLFGSFLIIIGNTGFPCMLRFVIWSLSKLVPYDSGVYEELRFLLDHPRRCFTLMFPARATWWLFWVLVLLNGIDLLFFIILDLNDATVTVLTPGFRVLNGWFQAASTRTAGFACVNLAALHPAIQVSYLIMMYISVFPIAISVRRTNVYEEKSLGLWGGEDDEDEEGKSYVGQHLRRQLSFDLWYIFLGFFIIAIVEGGRLQDTNAYAFTMFAVLFEIVSAYGTVGLSLGYPNINASFSAEFAVLSKLVIIAMMLRGRHRGLPYALDRAILLPSENLKQKEMQHGRRASSQPPAENRESEDADESRLHRVNTGRTDRANTDGSSAPAFRHLRRDSEVSTTSKRSAEGRADFSRTTRRLSRVVLSGLSAGPSMPRKYE